MYRVKISEEMKGGNFERECIEENCDVEELAEVFDNTDVSEPIQLKYDKCSKVVTAGKMSDIGDNVLLATLWCWQFYVGDFFRCVGDFSNIIIYY